MSVTFVVVSVVLLCFRPIFPFSSFQPFLFIGGFDSSALCRSRRELSNEYLLAKFGFDTAENEPCKVCPLSAYRSPRSTYVLENPAYIAGSRRAQFIYIADRWEVNLGIFGQYVWLPLFLDPQNASVVRVIWADEWALDSEISPFNATEIFVV